MCKVTLAINVLIHEGIPVLHTRLYQLSIVLVIIQGDHTSRFHRDSPVSLRCPACPVRLTCCPVLFICKSFYVLKYFNINDKKHRFEQGY